MQQQPPKPKMTRHKRPDMNKNTKYGKNPDTYCTYMANRAAKLLLQTTKIKNFTKFENCEHFPIYYIVKR
jgi:hypothetical protein